ncbi:hypothetical protein [Microcoleus sp. herbarium2]|uniref:hypothetical protein n=1 Tax=Microcoleus sp. herbarium2 TaxID=3055433 RepID=UPI002FD2CC00
MRVGLVLIIGDRTCDRVTGLWPEILEKLGKSPREGSYPKGNRQFLIFDCIEIKVVLFLNISQAVNMTLDPLLRKLAAINQALSAISAETCTAPDAIKQFQNPVTNYATNIGKLTTLNPCQRPNLNPNNPLPPHFCPLPASARN